jgi:hypothetical protein
MSDVQAWVRARRWPLVLWALAATSGVLVRWWILGTSLGGADLDEATVAIQARRFGEGSFNAFFFNQPYGGTVETGLVALAFELLGSEAVVLKVVPMALAALAAAVAYLSARELGLTRTGQWCVPVLVWCGPAYGVFLSTKERGFYGVSLVLAAAFPYLVLRLRTDPSRRDAILLGACVGLGWWQTPLTLLVAVPAVAWLAVVHPRSVRALRWSVPAALVAALPWFWWNVGNGWASLRRPSGFGTSWWDRLVDWGERLAVVTGLETPFDAGRRLIDLGWAGLAIVVVVVVLATLRTRRQAPGLLAVLVVGYGLLYAVNTLAAGVGEDPRYTYLMVPVVALCLGAIVPDPTTDDRRFALALAVLVAATASTWWGVVGLRDAADRPQPNVFLSSPGIDEVAELLAERGIEVATTDWAGMQLAFATDEQVVGSSFAVPRLAEFEQRAAAAPRSTYVIDRGLLANAIRLQRYLDTEGIDYELHRIGTWRVFFIDEQVTPADAGLQVFGEQLGVGPGG